MVRAFQVGRVDWTLSGQSLASLFLIGCLPGHTVQKWAEAVGDHGDPLCKKLAKIGDAGAHRKNCQRDIMLIVGPEGCHLPQVYETDICLWDSQGDE